MLCCPRRRQHSILGFGFNYAEVLIRGLNISNSQYELESREFAPVGRELSAFKPENSPPLAGCFQAEFQNENCWPNIISMCKLIQYRILGSIAPQNPVLNQPAQSYRGMTSAPVGGIFFCGNHL